jgi:hypothetical protein
MNAILRSVFSVDVDDLATWAPTSTSFSLHLRLLIGPDPGAGEESFDITVCNAEWLAERASAEGIIDPRHHLVVDSFDWPTLSQYLLRRISACSGASWEEIAEKLARFAYWEFEDYREN